VFQQFAIVPPAAMGGSASTATTGTRMGRIAQNGTDKQKAL